MGIEPPEEVRKKVQELHKEDLVRGVKRLRPSLQIQLPETGKGEPTWMGLGVTANETMPIDMLGYIDWMSRNNEQYALLIADTLSSRYNSGLSKHSAIQAGIYAENALKAMAALLNAHQPEIIHWSDVASSERYKEIYGHIYPDVAKLTLTALLDAMPSGKKQNIIEGIYKTIKGRPYSKGIKEPWRLLDGKEKLNIVSNVGYPLEESAVTLYMNDKGWPTKVGHVGEKRYDCATLCIWSWLNGKEGYSEFTPSMHYLRGGYTPDGIQIAPYATWTTDMILLTDSLEAVKEKIGWASPYYRNWCEFLLNIVGCEPSDDLAGSLYNGIIEPVQNKLGGRQ